MSTLNVNSIVDEPGTGSPDFPNGASVNGNPLPTAGSLSNRNKIINGAMVIAQRTTGAITVDNTGYKFGVDRTAGYSNTAASTYTVQQSSVAPAGFKNSFVATVATAGTPAAGVEQKLFQYVEGYNVAELGFGSSGAQSLTLSFWVRSSVTGTYAIGFFNADGTRAYSTTYTISAADTFEYKQITIPGDTSGSWNTTNGIGFGVNWYLGAGSNFHIATGAWTTKAGSYAAADSIYGAGNSSGVNWIATAGATFYITGVQLEVGDTATPFEHRSYGQELALCQRYFALAPLARAVIASTTTTVDTGLPYPVQMRANATITARDVITLTNVVSANYAQSSASITVFDAGNSSVYMQFGNFTGLTAGNVYLSRYDDMFVNVSAEL
jgi:hypothetical protein